MTMKLNAEQRNVVRAIVRDHPDFKGWRVHNGNFASRDLTGPLLAKAIADLGLGDDVAVALNMANATAYDAVAGDGGEPMDESENATLPISDDSDLAETVLSPLRPFLSPTLLDTVASALSPIVALANKPAVEKTITVERIVDASGAPIVPAFVAAQRVGASTIGKLFGISSRAKHADKPMSLWNAVDAPPVDPFYVPDVDNLSMLISAIDPALPRVPRNVWLAGPAGTGKSTLPEQIAARAQRPFVAITFQRAVEPADIIGGNGLANGATVWVDGVLTRAIRRPGTIILLDEITLAPPGLAAMLQTLLASRSLTLPTGEVVRCADGVTFVAADNTRGYGDESGLYAGTHQANAALVDRMARMIVVDYLDAALEAQALANHTLAPKAACERVVRFIGLARKLPGFETVPLSLRRQVAFVEMAMDGYKVDKCFEACVLSRLPDAERATIHAAFTADFDKNAFMAELTNQPVPAPTNTSTAFDVIDPA
jgi:MoxR-like ATPase